MLVCHMVLVLLAAGRVIELPFAPLLVAALPNDYIVTDFSERRQYTPPDRRAATVGDGGKTAAEPLVDFIKGIVLGQLTLLLDD